MKKVLLIMIFPFLMGFLQQDTDIYLKINKSIENYGKIYREIALNYVDEINPEEFMLAGIKGMLSKLDPYSVYIDKQDKKDIDIITSGKYGGIGATVGLQNDKIFIADLMEGYPAYRQGLQIGDFIIKVDSVEVGKSNYSELGNYLKKKPGDEVKLLIERDGESELLNFNIICEEITIKNLVLYKFLPENSGNAYFKLSGFSRTAGDEILKAFNELSKVREVKSIILDLRGNPGGLLDAAIDVAEKFLPRESLIVTVKGRYNSNYREYFSKEEPIAGNSKIIVLIDQGSASASEIVAGAIQDNDRGVIVGEKSFGKGLVQSIIPLSFDTSLKLTTARYYTPSGRCIQKVDYSSNNKVIENSVVKKVEKFHTHNNRLVLSGGGITPDSTVSYEKGNDIFNQLNAQGFFFKFATNYFNQHKQIQLDKVNNEDLFEKFSAYLLKNNLMLQSKIEKKFNELKNLLKNSSDNTVLQEIEKLETSFKTNIKEQLAKSKKLIVIKLREEISARISGRTGRIIESLLNDKQFETAVDILENAKLYKRLLNF